MTPSNSARSEPSHPESTRPEPARSAPARQGWQPPLTLFCMNLETPTPQPATPATPPETPEVTPTPSIAPTTEPETTTNAQNPNVAPTTEGTQQVKPPIDSVSAASPPSFEFALEQLGELVNALEQGNLSLEESLQTFEQGIQLIRWCQGRLDQAELRVQELLGVDDQNQPLTQPFQHAATHANPNESKSANAARSDAGLN